MLENLVNAYLLIGPACGLLLIAALCVTEPRWPKRSDLLVLALGLVWVVAVWWIYRRQYK